MPCSSASSPNNRRRTASWVASSPSGNDSAAAVPAPEGSEYAGAPVFVVFSTNRLLHEVRNSSFGNIRYLGQSRTCELHIFCEIPYHRKTHVPDFKKGERAKGIFAQRILCGQWDYRKAIHRAIRHGETPRFEVVDRMTFPAVGSASIHTLSPRYAKT